MTALATTESIRPTPRRIAQPARLELGDPAIAFVNASLLRLLERVALRFERAGIALMVLKGAALNLTIHRRPGERPMSDLDLMVRPNCAGAAVRVLTSMGCRPGRPLVRRDFFPRYHYERDFTVDGVLPLRIDLHARPFRPLRYARRVPADAFWTGAETVRVGRGRVLMPGVEDMLLHLAVHSAVHGNSRRMWLEDLVRWTRVWGDRFDWGRFETRASRWGLTLPAHAALAQAEAEIGAIRPPEVRSRMAAARSQWRDRRALRQAPDDASGAVRHVFTDALCVPGMRYRLGYMRAMLLPDRAHMAEWYDHRHAGWLPVARMLRLAVPVLRRVPAVWRRVAKVEIRETARGPGVFATRVIRHGERVFTSDAGATNGISQGSGKLACVRHSCQPNARCQTNASCRSPRVVALRFIPPGEEITLDFGIDACNCRRPQPGRSHRAQRLASNS